MPRTEMADHFLESVQHKTHENVGLVFVGKKNKRTRGENTLKN